MLRSIGAAEEGAVRVDGGADQVLDPRLPNELELPARASARPGDRARTKASAAAAAIGKRKRAIRMCFADVTGRIWCANGHKARGDRASRATQPDTIRPVPDAQPMVKALLT